jgi:hypothetical protein
MTLWTTGSALAKDLREDGDHRLRRTIERAA